MVLERLAAPGELEDLDDLAVAGLARLGVDAETAELAGLVAAADAEVEPSTREDVDHGGVLGQTQRVVERQDHDGGADADAARGLGGRGRHQQRAAEQAVAREVVLGEPGRVEAEGVGQLDLLERLEQHRVVTRSVRREQVLDAELHGVGLLLRHRSNTDRSV